MTITVFKKKITPKNGSNPFHKYVTTITDKDGVDYYCEVKFRDGLTIPSTFPCIVMVDKPHMNLTHKVNRVTDDNGEVKEYQRNTLWVNNIDGVSEYVDHSLDNFD